MNEVSTNNPWVLGQLPRCPLTEKIHRWEAKHQTDEYMYMYTKRHSCKWTVGLVVKALISLRSLYEKEMYAK
jgi:hypothetical protein